ncbi:hypothetical protein B1T50_04685 [Mycobacterium kansasii]|nr:hypothetical protein B1T50_04685 [Mycobacterium kansasii]
MAREYTRRWRAKNPEKRRAHRKVELAIKAGRMASQSCQVCGDAKSQAHHDDYSKPLEVVWLCALHHKARHKYLTRNQIDPDAA